MARTNSRINNMVDTQIYPIWIRSWPVQKLLVDWNLSPISTFLLTFLSYWGLSFLVSVCEGTFLRGDILEAVGRNWLPLHLTAIDINEVVNAISARLTLRTPEGLAYLNDQTHFLFSILVSAGGGVASRIIRDINLTMILLRNDGIPLADENKIRVMYGQYLGRAYDFKAHALCFVVAIGTLAVCLLFTHSPHFSQWWGYYSYGYAGIIFSLVASLMVYCGSRSIFILGFGALMFARLLENPIQFRPFHADGCHGLAPLGRLIILLWSYALLLALAIFITLHFGYLEVERTPLVWLLAVIGASFIPALAIVPLLSTVRTIRQAQIGEVALLEPSINQLVAQVRQSSKIWVREGKQSIYCSLERLQSLHETFRAANVLPFRPRVLTAVLIANVAQLLLLAKEIIEKFI